jgi:hypothetical protein
VYDLGLSDAEFWKITPRQYDALYERHKEHIQRWEYMFAQNTAYTVNFSMGHPKEPISPSDLMPSMAAYKEPVKRSKITKKEQSYMAAMQFKMMSAAHNAAIAAGKPVPIM